MDTMLVNHLQETLRLIRRNQTVPLIYEKLLVEIREKRLASAEEAIPSVAELAKSLRVARQTIQKVYDRLAAENLIYRRPNERNWYIRNLRQSGSKSGGIALLLPIAFSEYYCISQESGQRHFSIYSGMVDRAMAAHVPLTPIRMLPLDATADEIREWIAHIRDNYLGVIHVGNRTRHPDPPLAALCRTADFPQISVNWENDLPWGGAVTISPESTIRTVLGHLYELGHRNICIAVRRAPEVQEGSYVFWDRAAIEKVLHQTGLFSRHITFLETDWHNFDESIEEAIDPLLGSPAAPTAFWGRNDHLAMAVIHALKRRKLRIPEDISVLGFGDIREAALHEPPLSTLRNPTYELGYTAVSQFFEHLKKPDAAPSAIRLQPSLCLRESCSRRSHAFDQIHGT